MALIQANIIQARASRAEYFFSLLNFRENLASGYRAIREPRSGRGASVEVDSFSESMQTEKES